MSTTKWRHASALARRSLLQREAASAKAWNAAGGLFQQNAIRHAPPIMAGHENSDEMGLVVEEEEGVG